MQFTKPNLQYSSIQEHIKGITFISHGSAINRGSVNFLKTAYGNPNNANLEKAAKLLASHMWSITRDTTMVLITTAILVLAEKNKEEFEEELNSIRASEIQNLFVNMGSGNGAQAKTFVKSLEDLFKAILQKGKIDENKANRVWNAYLAKMGKMKKWNLSLGTLRKHIAPILEVTLQTAYYNEFKSEMPLPKKSIFKSIKSPFKSKKKKSIFDMQEKMWNTLPEQAPPTEEYEEYPENGNRIPQGNAEAQETPKTQSAAQTKPDSRAMSDTVEKLLKNLITSHDIEVFYHFTEEEISKDEDYKFQTQPFTISGLPGRYFECSRDSIVNYLLQNNITEEHDIEKYLKDCFELPFKKVELLKKIPDMLKQKLKTPPNCTLEFEIINKVLPLFTGNGLQMSYSMNFKSSPHKISIYFNTDNVLDNMGDNPENIIDMTAEAANEILPEIMKKINVKSIINNISKELKGKNVPKTSLVIGFISTANYEESECEIDNVKVDYEIREPKEGEPNFKKLCVWLNMSDIMEKLEQKGYKNLEQIENFISKSTNKVLDVLGGAILNKKYPPEQPTAPPTKPLPQKPTAPPTKPLPTKPQTAQAQKSEFEKLLEERGLDTEVVKEFMTDFPTPEKQRKFIKSNKQFNWVIETYQKEPVIQRILEKTKLAPSDLDYINLIRLEETLDDDVVLGELLGELGDFLKEHEQNLYEDMKKILGDPNQTSD